MNSWAELNPAMLALLQHLQCLRRSTQRRDGHLCMWLLQLEMQRTVRPLRLLVPAGVCGHFVVHSLHPRGEQFLAERWCLPVPAPSTVSWVSGWRLAGEQRGGSWNAVLLMGLRSVSIQGGEVRGCLWEGWSCNGFSDFTLFSRKFYIFLTLWLLQK